MSPVPKGQHGVVAAGDPDLLKDHQIGSRSPSTGGEIEIAADGLGHPLPPVRVFVRFRTFGELLERKLVL